MTLAGSLSLFLAMLALAALPSSSVALVVVRSATHGVRHGIAAALGIALGDLVFVALAIAGLAVMAEMMGAVFAILRYVAAGCLVWFGLGLIPGAVSRQRHEDTAPARGVWISFLAGIALTLGDVKAILFYAALFPVFVDVPAITASDIALIAAITVVAVAGVKIAYALAARTIANASRAWPFQRAARTVAGAAMIGAGGYLALKP